MQRNFIIFPVFALMALLCCGFTICHKVQNIGDGAWRIYIYPVCGDTGTYLVQEYKKGKPFTERILPEGKWTTYRENYEIHESLFIAGIERQTIEIVNYKHNTSIRKTSIWGKHQRESQDVSGPVGWRSIDIDDSLSLTISYYQNGKIETCVLSNNRQRDKRQVIEFDSITNNCWIGMKSIRGSVRDTTIIESEETGEIVTLQRTSDIFVKTGLWRKCDSSGVPIEDVFYK